MDDEGDLKHPSSAIKVSYDINRMKNVKYGVSIRTAPKEAQEDASQKKQEVTSHTVFPTRTTHIILLLLNDSLSPSSHSFAIYCFSYIFFFMIIIYHQGWQRIVLPVAHRSWFVKILNSSDRDREPASQSLGERCETHKDV